MEEKQINKWLRRRFTAVGWTLVVYNVILNLVVIVAMFADMLSQFLKAAAVGDYSMAIDESAIMGNAWGYILAIAVGAVILWAWKGGDYWREEILVKEKPITAPVFFCLLCFLAGAQMVSSLWIMLLETVLNLFGRSAMDILESVSGDSDTFSMFLYSTILAPISEEILFRGFVLRSLRPFGKRFAILGSAFLFAIFHGNLLQAPYAFLAGLVLGYAAVEYSITWATVLHIFNNLVLADLLTRLLNVMPTMAADIFSLLLFGSFAAASVVILTRKRREIKTYRSSEWMDRRCLKCFFTNSGVIVLPVAMAISMLSLLFA